MPYLTVQEFYSTKLYELDNSIYNPIERAFCRFLGESGKKFLYTHLDLTVAQLSVNSAVDIMGYFKIIG